MKGHPVLTKNPRSPGPSGRLLRILKEEFSNPDINLQEDILPCETPAAELLGEKSATLGEGFLPGEFEPSGLKKSYRDPNLHLELPLFGVINIRRSSQRIRIVRDLFEKTRSQTKEGSFHDLDNSPTPTCLFLPEHAGLEAIQKTERLIRLCSWIPAVLAALAGAYFSQEIWTSLHIWPGQVSPLLASAVPALLTGSLLLVCVLLPLQRILTGFLGKSLEETVRFELPGLLPPPVRDQLRELLPKYDDIYLVCDARNAWETEGSCLLTNAQKKELDPLIIGEKKGRFFLLGWFDLTEAEEWLRES